MDHSLKTIAVRQLAGAKGGFRLGEMLGVSGAFAVTGALTFGAAGAMSRSPRRVIGRATALGAVLYGAGAAAIDALTQTK